MPLPPARRVRGIAGAIEPEVGGAIEQVEALDFSGPLRPLGGSLA